MIQEIEPYEFNNQYLPVEPSSDSYLVLMKERTILLRENGDTIELPQFHEVSHGQSELVYLFTISGRSFFYMDSEALAQSGLLSLSESRRYEFCDLSVLRRSNPKWLCFAAITAYQLGCWYQNNRFCGKCGHELHKHDRERALLCSCCKNMVYPKICPAVIVGVVDGDRILLTKYANRPNSTRYALVAGFAEVGETIEQTVQREVMEEVGLLVKNIRYYKSQPWSFSDTLLLGFFCEVDGTTKITLDRKELSVAEWVSREDMTMEDDGISLTYEMMAKFKYGEI